MRKFPSNTLIGTSTIKEVFNCPERRSRGDRFPTPVLSPSQGDKGVTKISEKHLYTGNIIDVKEERNLSVFLRPDVPIRTTVFPNCDRPPSLHELLLMT